MSIAPPPKPQPKPPSKPSSKTRSQKLPTVERLLAAVEKSLDADKAEDIVTLPLTGKSSMGDYMVVATGRNARQIAAMADHLATKLKSEGAAAVAIEGLKTCEWVLIDCGDIIVHLFRPEIRAFYNLEKMWGMDMPGDRPATSTGKSRARA